MDGIKIKEITDGIESIYIVDSNVEHSQILEKIGKEGEVIVRYTYGDDLISQKRGDEISYYLFDGLGSTRLLTDANGNITDSYHYDAFGEILFREGETVNEFLFAGEQYDANVGFYYLRARWYDPSSGRFISMDTHPGVVYDPRTLHKYTYCGNNPINHIDPSGEFFSLIEISIVFPTIKSMQINYAKMNLNILRDSINIAEDIIRPAVKAQEVFMLAILEGDFEMVEAYTAARALEMTGYQMIGKSILDNMEKYIKKTMKIKIEIKFKDKHLERKRKGYKKLRKWLILWKNIMNILIYWKKVKLTK